MKKSLLVLVLTIVVSGSFYPANARTCYYGNLYRPPVQYDIGVRHYNPPIRYKNLDRRTYLYTNSGNKNTTQAFVGGLFTGAAIAGITAMITK